MAGAQREDANDPPAPRPLRERRRANFLERLPGAPQAPLRRDLTVERWHGRRRRRKAAFARQMQTGLAAHTPAGSLGLQALYRPNVQASWPAVTGYALNVARAQGTQADIFGTSASVFANLASLGVNVLRQGGVELGFGQWRAKEKIAELPAPAEMRVGIWLLAAEIESYLRAAWEHNIQVTLTLGTLGAGGQTEDVRRTSNFTINAVALRWAEANRDVTLEGERLGSGTGALIGLNIRSPYQRAWLRNFARSRGEAVQLAERAIRADHPDFVLADVLLAIEIFNEVQTCNIVVDNEDSALDASVRQAAAADWARVVAEMAAELRTLPDLDEVEVWGPGLWSYDAGPNADAGAEPRREAFTWRWTCAWFHDFAEAFVAEAARLGAAPSRLLQHVDVHWYHRQPSGGGEDSLGPRHCSRLVYELGELRTALDGTVLQGVTLSVIESGVSILEHGRGSSYDYRPDNAPRAPVGAWRAWQADEVWRRLAAAWAGGARLAGWHCLQSDPDPSTPFHGCGLLVDQDGTESTGRGPRMSWHSYNRFVQFLSTFASAKMLLPPTQVGTYSAPRTDDAVVIEFMLPLGTPVGSWAWGYLLFLDRWRDTRAVTIRLDAAAGVGAELWEASLWPATVWENMTKATELPVPHATWDDTLQDRGFTASTAFQLTVDDPPRLFFTNTRLAARVLTAAGP